MNNPSINRPKSLRAVLLCGVLFGILLCLPLYTIPIGVILIVLSIFMWKGKNCARIGLTIFYALSLYSALTTGLPFLFFVSIFGLSVLCLVISWSPSVNAWFRAIKEGRAE